MVLQIRLAGSRLYGVACFGRKFAQGAAAEGQRKVGPAQGRYFALFLWSSFSVRTNSLRVSKFDMERVAEVMPSRSAWIS